MFSEDWGNVWQRQAGISQAPIPGFLFLLHRTIGNVLIAVGAMLPAFGGTFSRFGIPGALYVGELLGAVIMFLGFLRATTPMAGAAQSAEQGTQA